MKRLVAKRAAITAMKGALIIMSEDGSSILIHPELARTLAVNLSSMATVADSITEDPDSADFVIPTQMYPVIIN